MSFPPRGPVPAVAKILVEYFGRFLARHLLQKVVLLRALSQVWLDITRIDASITSIIS